MFDLFNVVILLIFTLGTFYTLKLNLFKFWLNFNPNVIAMIWTHIN